MYVILTFQCSPFQQNLSHQAVRFSEILWIIGICDIRSDKVKQRFPIYLTLLTVKPVKISYTYMTQTCLSK